MKVQWVLSRYVLGRIEKNHENLQSVQPVSGPRFEPKISPIRSMIDRQTLGRDIRFHFCPSLNKWLLNVKCQSDDLFFNYANDDDDDDDGDDVSFS
jgi:hypothetical protein